jgi:hypothetical protein
VSAPARDAPASVGVVCKRSWCNSKSSAPAPKTKASAGAPLSVKPNKPSTTAAQAATVRTGRALRPANSRVTKPICTSSGVVSCANWAKPKQAINASRPPSAIVRA